MYLSCFRSFLLSCGRPCSRSAVFYVTVHLYTRCTFFLRSQLFSTTPLILLSLHLSLLLFWLNCLFLRCTCHFLICFFFAFAYFKEYLQIPPKLVEKYSPINLRSNSSISEKSTINDILLAIELINKVQDELKAENKLLLDALKYGFDSLTSRFNPLSATLFTLNTKVTSLDTRIWTLKSTSLFTHSPLTGSEVISEFAEHDRSNSNVLAHGLPESSASDFIAKIVESMKSLLKLSFQLSFGAPVEFKAILFGKLTSNFPRPFEIIFCD